ncbi:hypothetical protein EJB05_48088 [Eragrostis curvula]|uniref:Uncharacterized protein n=1 Tax=Eragrostis curvula TaxID=38414 RepID=A0A5J9T0X4_9POAL|nr:hypothetical protein EJB05_48088 [Eragrostis curvula]
MEPVFASLVEATVSARPSVGIVKSCYYALVGHVERGSAVESCGGSHRSRRIAMTTLLSQQYVHNGIFV